MNKLGRKLHKVFSIISGLSLAFNSILPASVLPLLFAQPAYAQTITPTDTTTPTPTTDPTVTTAPTDTTTPTPTVSPTDTLTPTPTDAPTPTDTPADTITPTPTDIPTVTPTDTPNETGPPTPTPGQILDGASTVAPTPTDTITPPPTITPTPTPEVNGHLEAAILKNANAQTLDLSTTDISGSAVLTTNKPDYAPTDTVVISGSGFVPKHPYKLFISSTDPPAVNFETEIKTDDTGSFIYSYQLDGNYRPNYTVIVKEGATIIATTTFTDAISIAAPVYSQCSNDLGTGYTSGDLGCRWINGNLVASNSTYHEGDSTVQRALLTDVTNGSHTVQFQYDTTKGGKHAYDFLTNDKFSEDWVTDADMCDDASAHNFADCATTPPTADSALNLIPLDINASGHDNSLTDANRHIRIRNGIIDSISTPTIVSGDYTGDSDTAVTVTFHVDTSTCANGYNAGTKNNPVPACAVLLTFGAHVSKASDWGAGTTAISITGSPYHVALQKIDGTSIGQRDNQMQASAIVIPTTLTVNKICVPTDDPGKFNLKIDGTTAGTGADASCGGTTGAVAVTATSHAVSETAGTGTNLSNYTTVIGGDCAVNGSITLTAGQAKVCTITNIRNSGTIELKKVWSETGGQTTLNIGTTAGASDIATQLTGTSGTVPLTTGTVTVNTGTYYVSETGGLTDYSSLLACTDNGQTATITNNSVSVITGHAVICTFTNTRNQGKIELQKHFVGNPENVTIKIGTSQNGSQIDSDVLSADGTDGKHSINTGTYYVSETLTTPSNYTSGLACYNDVNHNNTVDQGDTTHTINSDTGAVTVGTNDDVLCVYTNTRKTGTIELKKHWVGTAGSTSLTIGNTIGGNEIDTQAVSGSDGTTGQNTVDTGTYYANETGGLTNYDSSALSCFNDANNNGTNDGEDSITVGTNNAVTVESNQHIVCSFTNTRQQGSIELQKNFVGTPENVIIKIGTGQGGSQVDSDVLSADGTDGEHLVDTGNYFVSETLTTPANYDTTLNCYNDLDHSNTINEGDTVHSVNTQTGEVTTGKDDDVICRFTNTRKQGTIELRKIWSGTAGQTTLNIGTTAGASDVATQLTGAAGAAPLTTGQNTVDTGTYFNSETGGLTNYASVLSCFNDVNNNGINNDEASVSVGANDSVSVGSGQHVICTYTNTRKTGTLLVHKIQDTNGDGTFDTLDSEDFTWGIDGSTFPYAMGGLGQTLNTGPYSVSESPVTGYQLEGWYAGKPQGGEGQYSCDTANHTLPADVTVTENGLPSEITICNKFLNPILTISKENNTGGATRHPSDNVLFTITVTATQSAAFNVHVTDLPAGGFVPRDGTYTEVSSTRGDIFALTGNPGYHSPGVWNLGNMSVGEKVTITYLADIAGNQQPGTYYDLAWAAGCKTNTTCGDVLANAVNPGFISDNYVGTQIPILVDQQNGQQVKVIGEVLGASTELPATGASTFWLYVAFALLGGGLTLGSVAWFLRRQHE